VVPDAAADAAAPTEVAEGAVVGARAMDAGALNQALSRVMSDPMVGDGGGPTISASGVFNAHGDANAGPAAIEEEDPLQREAEEEAHPDAARQMLRARWRDLKSGGNSARLGNLIDLWFAAGALDASNQTTGRSPFVATSSLAELYRRSALREESWDCLKLGNARCTDGASPRGICHEEAGAPEQMCFSRFLLSRQPTDGAAFAPLAKVNHSEALWWLLQTRQFGPLASLVEPAGAELRSQMHAYAAHYARQMWPGTAKKMGMAERHLVVHYRVGDVAVGPVLAPGSLVAAIKALSPPPRTVEILSGGVKHDAECAEAMEAYLERLKAQQRREGVLGGVSDLAVRLEASRADHGLRKQLMDECRSKSIGLLDRLRAGIQKVLPESDVLFDAAGSSTVDEDFFKAANAPMLVVGGGSFAAAAALASKSEAVRSPACGPEGCQWLQLTHNSEEQAREVRPGWSTFAYDMEE